jgi:hypothetical protein
MHRPENIQLNIASPCDKSWAEMTPEGLGRHCAHCCKTVIDFTTWSDMALHQFFTENKAIVCGRFLPSQLQRSVALPPQPNSVLYRVMVALGLTLIFVPDGALYAQNYRAPLVAKTLQDTLPAKDTTSQKKGTVSGKVTNEWGLPFQGASVELNLGRVTLAITYTDSSGDYIFTDVAAGVYTIAVNMTGFELYTAHGMKLDDERSITVDVMLVEKERLGASATVITGGVDVIPASDRAPVMGKFRNPTHSDKKRKGLSVFLHSLFHKNAR